ncbi:MAG: hypothetical protein HGA87_00390 [Desulfobulbaceae bacterium]|nr:hypothetical protein [Desulfobulbaceae bacterium]
MKERYRSGDYPYDEITKLDGYNVVFTAGTDEGRYIYAISVIGEKEITGKNEEDVIRKFRAWAAVWGKK